MSVHDGVSVSNASTSQLNVWSGQTYRTASGAIDRLPSEVLATIFWWCCPTYMDRHRYVPHMVLRLSHVCTKWRRVAHQTPRLWTTLPLTVKGLELDCLDEPTRMLQHWLEHAHECPVVIDVNFSEDDGKRPPMNVLKQVIGLINSISLVKPFIVQEKMQLNAAIDAQMIANHPDNLFPDVAEQYSWTNIAEGEESPFPKCGYVQLFCTRRSPVVYGLEGHAPLGACLSRVELRDSHGVIAFCLDECWVMLENFTQLEYCGVRIGGVGPDEILHHLELLKLKSLALEWRQTADEGIGLLLDSIHTPNLSNLELRGNLPFRERIVGERWPHLRMFIERNRPPLHIMELAKIDCTVLDLIGCLAMLSATRSASLTHLTLVQCLLDNECIQKLWGDEESPEVLNAIRTLMRIEKLGMEDCDIYALNDLVCSLCVDYLLWPAARALVTHSQDRLCSLEELTIIRSGMLTEESQGYLNDSEIMVEYEEGIPSPADPDEE